MFTGDNPIKQWFSTFWTSTPGWRQIFTLLSRSQFLLNFCPNLFLIMLFFCHKISRKCKFYSNYISYNLYSLKSKFVLLLMLNLANLRVLNKFPSPGKKASKTRHRGEPRRLRNTAIKEIYYLKSLKFVDSALPQFRSNYCNVTIRIQIKNCQQI